MEESDRKWKEMELSNTLFGNVQSDRKNPSNLS